MALTPAQARAFYDRFGGKQDSQAFYEDAALDELVAHADFEHAETVFELGCGTGRFAARMLRDNLPGSASYLGMDISRTMTEIARQRLAPYAPRASVSQSDGQLTFPLQDRSADRVVSTYVLDLLPAPAIVKAISEASRVLVPQGRLCLVSLTHGVSTASRVVSGLWSLLYRAHAPLVGGCRPVRLVSHLDASRWMIEHHNVVIKFGVPSEVLVVRPDAAFTESLADVKHGAPQTTA